MYQPNEVFYKRNCQLFSGLKVTIFRAPNDCLQYLTGKTNRFKSFNGNSAKGMIQTQMYTVCIRRECGYCSMDVSESFVTTTTDPDPFDLHPTTADTALVGSDCTNSFVSIFVGLSDQNTDTKSDKFCGRRLGSKDGNTVSGTIRSNYYINTIGLKSGGIHLQCTKSVPILLNLNAFKF